MIRFIHFFVLCSLCLAGQAIAQESLQPFSRVEVAAQQAVIGKPVKVTVTLMVPTSFRVQPEFPVYDGVNVIVKIPELSMPPVIEYIDGTQWSGASQTYLFYPMKPGEFAFDKAQAAGIYTDPVDSSSATAEFAIEGFAFSAVVPAGAQSLDPVIVADKLTLEQSWDGVADGMQQGEAITRSITASIEGSSALFLPPLIPLQTSDLVKGYPQQQEVRDVESRQGTGGIRTESITYVAQYGGEAVFPDIEVHWFNATTGEVETAVVKGRSVAIDAPAVPTHPLLTKKQLFVLAGILLALLFIGWGYRNYIHPVLMGTIAKLHLRWNRSEPYAARKVVLAIREHDLDKTLSSLSLWLERQGRTDDASRQDFISALLEISRERYGSGPKADWSKLEQAFRRMRKAAQNREAAETGKALPDLNRFG